MSRAIVGLLIVASLAACGGHAADYRNPDQLASAVKAELKAEGKSVRRVICLRAPEDRFDCAYQLTDGLAAVRHVTVALDGSSWSQG